VSVIRFEDPPNLRRHDNTGISAALKAAPGRWAVVAVFDDNTGSRAYAGSMRRGARKAFRPAGTFEAASRLVDGENRVYARYVGEVSDGR
jgi:hypothetical protein